jgi:hypothetical protein
MAGRRGARGGGGGRDPLRHRAPALCVYGVWPYLPPSRDSAPGTPGGTSCAKVRHSGSNLLKCPRGQMGTKPAKVGHLAGLHI